jgi:hypothetical protein
MVFNHSKPPKCKISSALLIIDVFASLGFGPHQQNPARVIILIRVMDIL